MNLLLNVGNTLITSELKNLFDLHAYAEKEVKRLYEKGNFDLSKGNLFRSITLALNSDVLVHEKVEEYSRILNSFVECLNEEKEDIQILGNIVRIIKDLDSNQLQVLKLVYKKLMYIKSEDIQVEISKLSTDYGFTTQNRYDIIKQLFSKYGDINAEYLIQVIDSLYRMGLINYRAESFGMVQSYETTVLEKLPTISPVYRRELYLLFS